MICWRIWKTLMKNFHLFYIIVFVFDKLWGQRRLQSWLTHPENFSILVHCESRQVLGVHCESRQVHGVHCESRQVLGVHCESRQVLGVHCESRQVLGVHCESRQVLALPVSQCPRGLGLPSPIPWRISDWNYAFQTTRNSLKGWCSSQMLWGNIQWKLHVEQPLDYSCFAGSIEKLRFLHAHLPFVFYLLRFS